MTNKAITIDASDQNGNGFRDLSICVGSEKKKIITLYDVAYIAAKFLGGALAAFTGCSLVGIIF